STARHAALAVLLIAALTAAALFGGRPTPAAAAPCPSSPPPSKPALPFPLPTLPTPSPSSNPIGDFLNAVGKKLGILPKTGSPTPAPPPSPPPPNPLPKKLKTNRDKALAMTSGCAPARTGTAPGQLRVNAVPSTQTTALLNQNGLAYGGVVTLTTGTGGTVRALKFTVATSTSTPFQLQVPVGRHTLDIRSSKLTIAGNVVLYTTSISGKLFGLIPVTFTPDSPPPLVVPNLFFTNATVKLLYISADTLTAPALSLAYGS
ncbi:MAG TPA: hypothetical protein VJT31_21020, partial [Rugosimonospora sp.]|nr:hypothetical protein [Rugosimonospora sp.]